MDTYHLFTDGGCWPNPGTGGWAFILQHVGSGKKIKRSGKQTDTTNNRMELTAVIRGLSQDSLPANSNIKLYSDSEYVVKGINQWRHNWIRRNWSGVMNNDLWQLLNVLICNHVVEAIWVQGHNGHPENEECDRLCLAAYRN